MRRALVLILTVAAGVPAAAEVRLLMVEQPGCAHCARRDAGIAPIYPRMPEGQAAAPERVQLKGPYPANVALGPTPVFTPTFNLVRNGEGDGRVEDYPGEDFFWGMLAPILAGAGEIPAKAAP